MMKRRSKTEVSRRQFLQFTAVSSGALFLAACTGGTAQVAEEVAQATAVPPTSIPPTSIPATAAPVADAGEVKVIVNDVIDYVLSSDEWTGQYGKVTFKLHEGRFDGEPIYFIRTDASEQTFAQDNGLVFVPLLAVGRDIAESLYLFDNGQLPVLSSSPAVGEDFTSLVQVKNVTLSDDSLTLDSAEAVQQAVADGKATVEETTVFVNYPVVKWGDESLAVDDEKTETLGKGQLMEPVDTDNMTVSLKLHQCFPGSRYILTDTSFPGIAPMMSVPPSVPNQTLLDKGGTDEIWIFVNGIPGSGVMGFQPAIFDNEAGQPAWSPFWDHRALKWMDESQARVLRSSAEVREGIASGELQEFMGVPDTDPNGFVVNCPAPILAPNDFTG